MCGICGKLDFKSLGDNSVELIKKMTRALHHRGPDETGIFVDDRIALGHARLSIIDLTGGTQPIHNEDETVWIVYNGEVFNYPELRADLLKKGHRFYTSTDTEVILHLFEDKGPECLDLLNGQFAFAIWNSQKKELFIARDRVGIRPLFYTFQNGSLTFASEIKSIFMDETIDREIDPRAMGQIFTVWTTLNERTTFKNIFELPPGHFLKIGPHQRILQRYWDAPFRPPDEHLDWSVDRLCQQIQELLHDAIRIRLRADVPVGCYVSGGLDSSGVATIVAKNFNNKLRTFGIRFEEQAFDEGDHQRQMVEFIKTDHTELFATNSDIGKSFPDVLWHCEKPLLRTAPVPLFLLSEVVNQNAFKVVLTGEGADEVFGGYNIFKEAKVRHFWARQPNSRWRGRLIEKLYPYIFKDPRLKQMQMAFFATDLEHSNDPLFSHSIRWQNTSQIKGMFSADLRSQSDDHDDLQEIATSLPENFNTWDYLARAQYLEMKIFLSNYLLSSQGDRVAMGHSLEIRLPYLDYRIIDLMSKVPAKWKIRGLDEKYILKKSFAGILPEEIVNRPKHPYRAPIASSFLNETNRDFTLEMLSVSSLKESGLFDPARVGNLINKVSRSGNVSERDNMALVGILSSQIIHDKFIAHFPRRHMQALTPDVIIDRRGLGS